MFEFIKKMFIEFLAGRAVSDHTNCISLNNQPCIT